MKWSSQPPNPRVGKTGIHLAQCFDGPGKTFFNLIFVRNIAFKCEDLPAVCLQFFSGSFIFFLVLTPYADIGTGLGQCLRHAKADTAIAARDQDSFAGEIECGICHNVPPNYFMLRIFFLRFNKIL